MKFLGRASTLTLATVVLGGSILAGINSASAAPFGSVDKTEISSNVHRVYGGNGGWRDEGNPFYFENCWWQKQRLYKGKRATNTLRNKKNSCPDLSYGAGSIRRPSPTLRTKPTVFSH